MFAVVFAPPAKADIDDALTWYDEHAPGISRRLIDEINAITDRISTNPLQFPAVHNSMRRALLKRFPYAMFFRVEGDNVQIVACMHTRRDPKQWRERF